MIHAAVHSLQQFGFWIYLLSPMAPPQKSQPFILCARCVFRSWSNIEWLQILQNLLDTSKCLVKRPGAVSRFLSLPGHTESPIFAWQYRANAHAAGHFLPMHKSDKKQNAMMLGFLVRRSSWDWVSSCWLWRYSRLWKLPWMSSTEKRSL